MRINHNTQMSDFKPRRSSSWNRHQNTTMYKSEVKLGPVTHTIFVSLVIAVLGLIYLTQATKITNYDYEAERIDSEIAELTNKKDDLEIENARLTALNAISSSEVASNMTKPAGTSYVSE